MLASFQQKAKFCRLTFCGILIDITKSGGEIITTINFNFLIVFTFTMDLNEQI